MCNALLLPTFWNRHCTCCLTEHMMTFCLFTPFPCRVLSISTSHLRITRRFQLWTLCTANMWRTRENPGASFYYRFPTLEMNLHESTIRIPRGCTKGDSGRKSRWVNLCVVMQVQNHWHHRKGWRAGCGESERVRDDSWRVLFGLWGDHHHEPGETCSTYAYERMHTCRHCDFVQTIAPAYGFLAFT